MLLIFNIFRLKNLKIIKMINFKNNKTVANFKSFLVKRNNNKVYYNFNIIFILSLFF